MQSASSRPVFIIGGSRTGSTMLQTILSKSHDICITDELQFRTRRWLRRDLVTDIRKHVGPLDEAGGLDRLVKLLYSGIPDGWFWSAADRLLDRKLLLEELSGKVLTEKSIFDAVLKACARSRGKPRIGAKFPMHYSYTDQLLEWYPDCLLVHTTRNPKAVYASQSAKYLKGESNRLARAIMRFKQFVHINIQISWTARLHNRLKHLPNYTLVRYEDLVTDPETSIRGLCDFLETGFHPDMLAPQQFGSSYTGRGVQGKGFSHGSLERWRSSIYPVTAHTINLMHPFAFSTLGYDKS